MKRFKLKAFIIVSIIVFSYLTGIESAVYGYDNQMLIINIPGAVLCGWVIVYFQDWFMNR